MGGKRSDKLIRELLAWCFFASLVGIITVIAYLAGALSMTFGLVFDILLPAFLMLAIDAFGQLFADLKLLKNLKAYLDGKENRNNVSHLALKAQEEIRDFPLKGALVSLMLWIVSALFVPFWFKVIHHSPHFAGRELWGIFVGFALGSLLAFIFQFFYYKRILRKHCADVLAEETGYHERQRVGVLSIQAKLMLSFVTLIVAVQFFAAFIAHYVTGEAVRQVKERDLVGMGMVLKGASAPEATISSFALATGLEIFIVDPEGKVVSGKPPKKEVLKEITTLVQEFTADIREWTIFGPAGQDMNYLMTWWKLGKEGWVNHRYDNGHTYRHRIPYSNDEFALVVLQGDAGYLVTVLEWSGHSGIVGKLILIFWLIAIVGALLSYYLAWLTARDVTGPLKEMLTINTDIAKGNLNQEIHLVSEDESGELAASLTIMARNLADIIGKVDTAAENVEAGAAEINKASDKVSEGSDLQVKAVEATLESTEEMNSSIKSISDNVEMLATSAEESSRYIQEMGGLVDELAGNIKDFSVAVESTSTAVLQMTASISNVADNVEVLNEASEDTASSMLEMNASIKQVQENASETLKLSTDVFKSAKIGVDAVQNTIRGNERIEESVREAKDVISGLESKAREIGKIVNVINDVTEKTNLLALNAAIIAAQAGKHGRGFGVVADQIKKLADATIASTADISKLVLDVQEGSAKAASSMDAGFQAVEEGVNLSFQAGQVLEQIEKSASLSTEMVNKIANATEEQVLSSKRVTEAVESIAQRIEQIAISTREQKKGSELIIQATEEMREISPMVKQKSEQLAEGGRQVNMAMDNINQMVSYINKSQQEQSSNSDLILAAVNQIKDISLESASSVTKLDEVLHSLTEQSKILKDEMGRFKL